MFQGSMVALITPMTTNDKVDESAFAKLIEKQIEAGTKAIIVNGTTGESSTLTDAEKAQNISIAVKIAAKRIPIIAGTGTYSTYETIKLSQEAKKLGADGCLVVTPYFIKPTQEGLYQHFKAITEAVSIPLILYNVPSRTACDLLPETIERLAVFPNIVGLKEATGDLKRLQDILKRVGNSMTLYSGDDATALDFLIQGGRGVISVTANVAPKLMSEMCDAVIQKQPNIAKAKEINTKLMDLHQKLFLQSNPIPVKWAVHQLGWASSTIRMPLTPLSQEHHEAVHNAMLKSGVI